MDGYTYMIERNKLLIHQERQRAESERTGREGTSPAGTDKTASDREKLMELYGVLEGCGRLNDPV